MFLQKLDGAHAKSGDSKKRRNILIIGMTNDKSALDKALLRLGRLARQIELNNSSVSDIVLLFKRYGNDFKLRNNVIEEYLEKNNIYSKIYENQYTVAQTLDYINSLNDFIKNKEESIDSDIQAGQNIELELSHFNMLLNLS